MILEDSEVTSRLASPLNLINKLNHLKSSSSNPMSLFIPSSRPVIDLDPDLLELPDIIIGDDSSLAVIQDQNTNDTGLDATALDQIIPDNAEKIKLGIVKTKALDVLHDSLHQLHIRLPEISKVRDLSTIASDMNRILTAEDSAKSKIHQQVIVYKPIINDLNKYETLVVNE